jgi:hypothetical protein
MSAATPSAIAGGARPPAATGAANGKPGSAGTTTCRSVSSGSTRSNRRMESGHPCSSTTGVAVAAAARRCTARTGVSPPSSHGSARIRASCARQSYPSAQYAISSAR